MSVKRLFNTTMTLEQIHSDLLRKLDEAYAALRAIHSDVEQTEPKATTHIAAINSFNDANEALWTLKSVIKITT